MQRLRLRDAGFDVWGRRGRGGGEGASVVDEDGYGGCSCEAVGMAGVGGGEVGGEGDGVFGAGPGASGVEGGVEV